MPLLLALIEGLLIDVTEGKKYFTKRQSVKAGVVNLHDLAGIEAGMAALKGAYAKTSPLPKQGGACPRHWSRTRLRHARQLGEDVVCPETLSSTGRYRGRACSPGLGTPLGKPRTSAVRTRTKGGRRVDDCETCEVLRLLRTSAMGGIDNWVGFATI